MKNKYMLRNIYLLKRKMASPTATKVMNGEKKMNRNTVISCSP